MSLPSQTARPSAVSGRSNMQRSKRPATRPILVGVGVIAILAVGIYALTHSAGGTSAASPQAAAGKQPEIKPAPLPEQAPEKVLATNTPINPPEPAPVEIRQGKTAGQQTGQQTALQTSLQAPGQGAPLLGHTPGADPKTDPRNDPKPSSKPATPPPSNPAPITPPSAAASMTVSAQAQGLVTAATQKLESGDPVGARVLFSRVLADPRISESDRQAIRNELSSINDDLVFSPRVAKDDPFTTTYAVGSGDSLISIARKLATGPDYRLIARINKLVDQHSLHQGQQLKVIKGPFHAIVNKGAYRMDVYMGPADKQEDWVYVRSFSVGLGKENGTPIGTFVVKKGSKLIDPRWTNPDTGEHFGPGDPKNPIGRRWVGLEGQGDAAKFIGYGIHGTIDPGSIGQQRSMGCIRMASEDIEVVWELLGQQVSVVKIVP